MTVTNSTIKGGTLTTTTGGVFEGKTAAVLDGISEGALTNDATYHVTNGTNTTVKGTITNTGTIDLQSVVSTTSLLVSGIVNLTGGGTVTLGNGVNMNNLNVLEGLGASGNKLINVDNEIAGYGRVGDNLMALDNQSTITANNAVQQLTFDLDDGEGQNVNAGTLRAINGATFAINATTDLKNTGGVIRADGVGSKVTLANSTIKGGTLTTTGGGVFEGKFGAVLDGLSEGTLTSSATYHVSNGTTSTITGDIANSGDIQIGSVVSTTQLRVSGTATLTGGGTVTLGNGVDINNLNILEGTGTTDTLVNGDNTIRGYGKIGDASLLNFDNQVGGTVHADATTALTIDLRGNPVTFTNAGTLRASGTGGITITDHAANTGTVEILSGSNLTTGAAKDYTQTAGTTMLDGGTLTTGGTVNIQGGMLTGSGDINGAAFLGVGATVSPGASPGILNFNNASSFSGLLQFDLAGLLVDGLPQSPGVVNAGTDPNTTEFDQINVYDTATLVDGMTFAVAVDPAFVPTIQLGDSFDVMTADVFSLTSLSNLNYSYSNGFGFSAQIVSAGGREALRLTTTVIGTAGLLGDINLDGEVGVADLGILAAQWGTAGSPPFNADISPPPTGDGIVNVGDLGIVAANWGATSGSSLSGAAIPGPAAALAGAALLLGLGAGRRRTH